MAVIIILGDFYCILEAKVCIFPLCIKIKHKTRMFSLFMNKKRTECQRGALITGEKKLSFSILRAPGALNTENTVFKSLYSWSKFGPFFLNAYFSKFHFMCDISVDGLTDTHSRRCENHIKILVEGIVSGLSADNNFDLSSLVLSCRVVLPLISSTKLLIVIPSSPNRQPSRRLFSTDTVLHQNANCILF